MLSADTHSPDAAIMQTAPRISADILHASSWRGTHTPCAARSHPPSFDRCFAGRPTVRPGRELAFLRRRAGCPL